MYFDSGDANNYEKNHFFYVRCVRYSNPLAFDSFLSFYRAVNTAVIDKEKLLLRSSNISAKEILLKYKGKNYFGTKEFIFNQLDLFSLTPYLEIQKRTQENLNDYLTIATVPLPTLPSPLNLVKDEFESKGEFEQRVKSKSIEREAQIVRLQEKYHQEVGTRNTQLELRKTNIEAKKKEYLFGNFGFVMGEPKLSNPVYDAETNTMFVEVSMSNAKWNKKVGIMMKDRSAAKAFKDTIQAANSTVTFAYENDAFVLKSIEVDFASKKYVATLTQTD